MLQQNVFLNYPKDCRIGHQLDDFSVGIAEDSNWNGVTCIAGVRGSGKSTVLNRIEWYCRNWYKGERRPLLVRFDIGMAFEYERFSRDLVDQLCREARTYCRERPFGLRFLGIYEGVIAFGKFARWCQTNLVWALMILVILFALIGIAQFYGYQGFQKDVGPIRPHVARADLSDVGNRISTRFEDGSVVVWSLINDNRWSFPAQSVDVTASSLAPSGDYYAIGAADGRVTLLPTQSDRNGNTVRIEAEAPITKVRLSSQGRYVAAIDKRGIGHINTTSGAAFPLTLELVQGQQTVPIRQILFSPSEDFAVAVTDQRPLFYDLSAEIQPQTDVEDGKFDLAGGSYDFTGIGFIGFVSGLNNVFVAQGFNPRSRTPPPPDAELSIWNLEGTQTSSPNAAKPIDLKSTKDYRILPDATFVAAWAANIPSDREKATGPFDEKDKEIDLVLIDSKGRLSTIDLSESKFERPSDLSPNPVEIQSAIVSENLETLVTIAVPDANDDINTATLWSFPREEQPNGWEFGEPVDLESAGANAQEVAFIDNDQRIVVLGSDGRARTYSAETGRLLKVDASQGGGPLALPLLGDQAPKELHAIILIFSAIVVFGLVHAARSSIPNWPYAGRWSDFGNGLRQVAIIGLCVIPGLMAFWAVFYWIVRYDLPTVALPDYVPIPGIDWAFSTIAAKWEVSAWTWNFLLPYVITVVCVSVAIVLLPRWWTHYLYFRRLTQEIKSQSEPNFIPVPYLGALMAQVLPKNEDAEDLDKISIPFLQQRTKTVLERCVEAFGSVVILVDDADVLPANQFHHLLRVLRPASKVSNVRCVVAVPEFVYDIFKSPNLGDAHSTVRDVVFLGDHNIFLPRIDRPFIQLINNQGQLRRALADTLLSRSLIRVDYSDEDAQPETAEFAKDALSHWGLQDDADLTHRQRFFLERVDFSRRELIRAIEARLPLFVRSFQSNLELDFAGEADEEERQKRIFKEKIAFEESERAFDCDVKSNAERDAARRQLLNGADPSPDQDNQMGLNANGPAMDDAPGENGGPAPEEPPAGGDGDADEIAQDIGAVAPDGPNAQDPVPAQNSDLEKIRGIGPVLAERLRDIGVNLVAEVAAWSQEDIERISREIGVSSSRIEKWVEHARELTGR